MKLVILLGVFLLITTGTWASSSNCAKGPKYWCRDEATAKRCGATSHCQQTVWREKEHKKPLTTHETAQMLCNVLVQASSELLVDKSINVDSIKQRLREDCTKLPGQNNLVEQCKMAVDLYLSDILRHIKSGTEATKICPIIQGHDTPSVFVPKPKLTGITSNQTCVLCEFVIHILQTFATANTSAQELAQILEKICNEMPTVLRDECKSFIDTYGIDVIALLIREFDPAKVCELIKVCPKPKNVVFLTKPNVHTCGLCDYISTYLSSGHAIENVCKYFSTENNLKQQCEVLVHLYKPNLCSQLPLCLNDKTIQPVKQTIQTTIKSAECSLCKYVISYIDNVIQNNRSEAAIVAALEKVCTILPGPIKDKCVQFVDAYGPIIVPLIEKYGTPEQVCDALKLCHNGTEILTLQPVLKRLTRSLHNDKQAKKSLSEAAATIGSVECSLCKYVVGYIDNIIQNNRTEAAIEAALEKVCGILPGEIKEKCVHFVDTYGSILVQLLEKYGSPDQVCQALQLCTKNTHVGESISHQIVTSMKKIKDGNECTLCKYIISYIDVVIQSNGTTEDVKKALELVCGILPESYHEKCSEFVQNYGPILAELIAELDDPNTVCEWLGICSKSDNKFIEIPSLKRKELKAFPCSLCQYLVNYLDAIIQSNSTETKFEEGLDKACKILPGVKLQSECKIVVHLYGADLIKILVEHGDPKTVCQKIGLCDK